MDNRQIAFRVDASTKIGTGHFMRCFTLANELLKQGAEVSFVCRHILPSLVYLLKQHGIALKQITSLNTPHAITFDTDTYADWLGTNQLVDAEATIAALSGTKTYWLIVDHYALDHIWETKLKACTEKIMVIDDLANRKHECDLLLDQNYYHDDINPYCDLVTNDCQLLIGPRYALLRPEFRQLRNQIKQRNHEVQRVLIFFGGVDASDMTSIAIEALSTLKELSFMVDVVIGNPHPNKEKIVSICQQLGYYCHVQTNKMAELMTQADLCIGAGGSATWERCALGLPSITFVVAENQQELTKHAAKACLIYAPTPSKNLVETIRLHFTALYNNALLREYISRKSMQLVDADGALRVVKELSL